MKEKQSLTRTTCARYRKSGKKEKGRILAEFCQSTGYNHKYALHLLANWGKAEVIKLDGNMVRLKADARKRRKGGGRKPLYGPEVIASLRIIWAFFWYRCGKLLAPLLREQMAFFEVWAPFHVTPAVREKLLKISPATIDRALKDDRKKLAVRGISGTKPGKLLKKHIPVRT
ncbi:MAG: hypothetical protein LBT11_03320 [Treponema sp.]|nr:hypothetical protein [Treponema sp.]